MPYAPLLTRLSCLRSTDRLERAMEERDISGSELANMAGTSRQSISRLRHGLRNRIDQRKAREIEKALRVKPGHLFTEDDQ